MNNYIKGEVEIRVFPEDDYYVQEEYALQLLSRQLADKLMKKAGIVTIENRHLERVYYSARCYVFTQEELLEQLRRAEEKGKAAVWDLIGGSKCGGDE